MTGDRQKFGDLQTVELDNALSGTAPSGLPVRLSPRLVWRLALGLMIVSGALALVASFAPWAIGRFTPYLAAMGFGLTPMNDPTLTALADLVLRSLRPPTNQFTLAWLIVAYVILAGQIVYAGLGAFIGVALSFHLQERARRVLLRVYGAWLATLLIRLMICTALLAVDARNVFASIEQIAPGGLASVAPAGGYWLAWLAAALCVVSLILARHAQRRGLAEPRVVSAPRSPMELFSAGVATVGFVVWQCGFFALPWATQGCAGLHFSLNHFVAGTCAGLDSADMLSRWSALSGLANVQYSAENPLAVAVAVIATMLRYATVLSMLLAAVSVGAVARLWLGPQGSGRYGLLLFCLIATGFFALAAWQGAASALAHPSILTYGVTGTPVYGPGVAVTLAGLALAALGLVGAFASRWRLARRR